MAQLQLRCLSSLESSSKKAKNDNGLFCEVIVGNLLFGCNLYTALSNRHSSPGNGLILVVHPKEAASQRGGL